MLMALRADKSAEVSQLCHFENTIHPDLKPHPKKTAITTWEIPLEPLLKRKVNCGCKLLYHFWIIRLALGQILIEQLQLFKLHSLTRSKNAVWAIASAILNEVVLQGNNRFLFNPLLYTRLCNVILLNNKITLNTASHNCSIE